MRRSMSSPSSVTTHFQQTETLSARTPFSRNRSFESWPNAGWNDGMYSRSWNTLHSRSQFSAKLASGMEYRAAESLARGAGASRRHFRSQFGLSAKPCARHLGLKLGSRVKL